jgi:hypothetical protein
MAGIISWRLLNIQDMLADDFAVELVNAKGLQKRNTERSAWKLTKQ